MRSEKIFISDGKGAGNGAASSASRAKTKDFENKILDSLKKLSFRGTEAEKEKLIVRMAGKVTKLSLMREDSMKKEAAATGEDAERHYAKLVFITSVLEHVKAEYSLDSANLLLDKALDILKSDSEESRKRIAYYNTDFKKFYMEEDKPAKA